MPACGEGQLAVEHSGRDAELLEEELEPKAAVHLAEGREGPCEVPSGEGEGEGEIGRAFRPPS